MDRDDFTIKYLIALYKTHRANRDSWTTVPSLKDQFDLPQDDYLEAELPDMLEHRGWCRVHRSAGPPESWDLEILVGGRQAAEANMLRGTDVELKVEQPDSGSVAEESSVVAAETSPLAIPASDRIVRATDNSEGAQTARDALAQLSVHLSDANDIGDMGPEEIAIAKSEVWQLEQAISAEAFRADWIEKLASSVLLWIADKAGGAVVGILAITALTAIKTWVGF